MTIRPLSKRTLLGIASSFALATLLPVNGFAGEDEAPNAITSNGISVEFAARAVGQDGDRATIMAGQDVELRFKLTNAATGTAISDTRAAVWVDARKKTGFMIPTSEKVDPCREKISSFLQGGLSYQPDIDLNAWYILALNNKASISVIDPLRGYGSQRVVTLIGLNSPGVDWVMARDRRFLFVALPATDEIAVVDTATWKVATNIKVGHNPLRIALQGDGRYLWAGHDGGVTIIDAERRAMVQGITTGAGRHDVAFGKGDQEAFVSNPDEGMVSLIDVGTLKIAATVQVGGSPGAIAYSPLANMVYVADAKSGIISAIDPAARKVVATMQAKPGLLALRFTADGRWGFVANQLANEVVVLDASTNRIAHRIDVESGPDQVSFGAQFAFVHATGSADVTLIALDSLGKQEPIIKTIPGGQQAPLADAAGQPATAPLIVLTPDQNTMLVANPSDKAIYFYTEGMNAPMGTFNNLSREMRAVLAVDRSLRETEPGIYTGYLQLPGEGDYDVAFHTSSPLISHCFTLTAARNPAFTARSAKPYHLEFISEQRDFAAGDTARVQFQMSNPATEQPLADIADLEVQVFLVPGTWRVLQPAKSLGNGIYEMTTELPDPGVYYLHVASPSLHARFNDLPSLTLRARKSGP